MRMTNVDIAIIGGGMVGLTLAASLANTKLRIAIIESAEIDLSLSEQPAIRVSALNRASETILQRLNAWQGIASRRFHPLAGMSVWERDSFAHIDFSAQAIGQQNLGYIVENTIIQQALYQQVQQQSNVKFYCPDKCETLLFGESENWLTLSSGQSLSAKLVVGADGANSWLRNLLAIPLTSWDYAHHALVANIRTELPHENIARQIFTPDGPLAFLPLSDPHLCSIVWSLPPTMAAKLNDANEDSFNKTLATAFDMRLGRCQLESKRMLCPLKMRYARDFVANRCALIGDAAHTIHPLAGQGVNLGLLDAAALGQEVSKLALLGKDIGEQANLRYFERWRKAEAMKMIAAMQAFHDLFNGDNPAKKLFRGIGVTLAATLPGIKDTFIQQALGLSGDLPELAKAQPEEQL